MKALRWILFCVLTFGLGTGAALVFHPPNVGIPTATASGLANDLDIIQTEAAAGKCTAVRSRVKTAQRRIDRLTNTNASIVDELNSTLTKVEDAANVACQKASDAAAAAKLKAQQDALATTPTTPEESTDTPTPGPTPTPDSTATPTSPDGGTALPTPDPSQDGNPPDDGSDSSGTGGVTLPNGQTIPGPHAIQRRLDQLRQEFRKRWGL